MDRVRHGGLLALLAVCGIVLTGAKPGQTVGELAIGETSEGELSSDDPTIADHGEAWGIPAPPAQADSHGDVWSLTIDEAGRYSLTLESTDANGMRNDTYLYLLRDGEDGPARLARNDDADGIGLNSRIQRDLEPGDYLVVASSFSPRTEFAYTLQVEARTVDETAGEPVGTVAAGETTEGELSADDPAVEAIAEAWGIPAPPGREESYGDVWSLRIDEGGGYAITLESTDDAGGRNDTYLYLLREGEDGPTRLARNDDAADIGLNSRITRELEPGSYLVVVSSFSPRTEFAYTLAVASRRTGSEVLGETLESLSRPADGGRDLGKVEVSAVLEIIRSELGIDVGTGRVNPGELDPKEVVVEVPEGESITRLELVDRMLAPWKLSIQFHRDRWRLTRTAHALREDLEDEAEDVTWSPVGEDVRAEVDAFLAGLGAEMVDGGFPALIDRMAERVWVDGETVSREELEREGNPFSVVPAGHLFHVEGSVALDALPLIGLFRRVEPPELREGDVILFALPRVRYVGSERVMDGTFPLILRRIDGEWQIIGAAD